MLLVLIAFVIVVRTEIAALIAEVPVQSQTYSPAGLDNLLHPNGSGTAFAAWATVPCPPNGANLAGWLQWYYFVDILFALGWAQLVIWPRRLRDDWCWLPGAVAAGASVLLSGCGLLGARLLQHPVNGGSACTTPRFTANAFLFHVMNWVIVLKWSALIALVLVGGYRYFVSREGRCLATGRRAVLKALLVQRYLLFVVLALCLLLVVHGPAMLDQGVDVERSWVLTDQHSRGLQSAGLAALCFFALCLGLHYLASVHVGALQAPESEESENRLHQVARSLRWLVAAGLVPLLSWVVRRVHWAVVDWHAVWVVAAVIVAVPVLSLFGYRLKAPEPPQLNDNGLPELALGVGRVLAYLPLVVLLLSVSRAFAPPFLLAYPHATCWLIVIPGVLAELISYAVLSFGRHPTLVGSSAGSWHPQRVGNADKGDHPRAEITIALLAPFGALIGYGLVMLLWQRQTADVVGVIGVFALGFGAISAGYAVLMVASDQFVRTPHLFELLGMRRTPLVGMTVVMMVITTFAAKGSSLHNVRGPVAGTRPSKPSATAGLIGAFHDWNDAWDKADGADPDGRTAISVSNGGQPVQPGADIARVVATGAGTAAATPTSCTSIRVTAGKVSARVRPMLFVAAEGGGIRAEVWTVDAMSRLMGSYQGCGKQAIFVASGVSGGAVGLGLLDTAPAPMRAMESSIGELPLANAVSGLMVHDLLAGLLGWNVRSIDAQPGEPAHGKTDPFPDRAALLEQAWERDLGGKDAKSGTGFGRPFPITGPDAASWRTVFNGTSVGQHCRALVTDLTLGSAAQSCTAPGNPVPGSYDLLASNACYRGLPTSTAALLAARFPYVTPSGVIRGCSGETIGTGFTDQLIDGGYSENTGMDTLDSLLSYLTPVIRAENYRSLVQHLAGMTAKPPRFDQLPVIVVPMLVFLHNTTAGTLAAEPKRSAQAELLIPPTNLSDGAVLGANDTLLQRAAELTGYVLPGVVGGLNQVKYFAQEVQLEDLVRKAFPTRAMTVAPQYAPQVALPLGWSISQETVDTMGDALNAYLKCQPSNGVTAKNNLHNPDQLLRATAQTDQCAQSQAFDTLAGALGVPRCFDGAGADGRLNLCTGPK